MFSFKIAVVSVAAVILILFAFGAYKAEKVVAQKAKEQREIQAVKSNTPNKTTSKATSKATNKTTKKTTNKKK